MSDEVKKTGRDGGAKHDWETIAKKTWGGAHEQQPKEEYDVLKGTGIKPKPWNAP